MAYLILCKTTGFGTLDPVIIRTLSSATGLIATSKDSSNNVFVAGDTDADGEGSKDIITLKYNQSGSLEWQRVIGSGDNEYGRCVTTDSSGNTIVSGNADNSTFGNHDVLIAKYDTSGTLKWQRVIGGSSADIPLGVATDASDNIYITGGTSSDGPGSTSIMLMKLNSSGIIQWQRSFGGTNSEQGNAIVVSGNDIYVAGYGDKASGFGSNDLIIVKYDTSGTYQWQRNIGGNDIESLNDISIDSTGNIYVVGGSESVPGSVGRETAIILKCNSSGTVQWQRALQGSYHSYFSGVAVDNNDNIYSVGRYSPASNVPFKIIIAKYNNSFGTVQWQRIFESSTHMNGKAITAVGNHVVISGNYSNFGLVAYLQNDGTGTGTYGIFTYDSVSLTEITTEFSEGDVGYTDEVISLSEQAGAFTNAVSTLTETNHS